MWKFYSDESLNLCELIPIFISFFTPGWRVKTIYYAFAITVLLILMNVTKLLYADPRPYWVNPDIIVGSCSRNYGNPSGHSSTVMGMSLVMWLDLCQSYSNRNKCLFLIPAILIPLTTGYSRLILGVHSLDQILYGLLLGVWVAFSMHYYVSSFIHRYAHSILGYKHDATTDSI
jgi:membrane-associated phospholipid phosphatase